MSIISRIKRVFGYRAPKVKVKRQPRARRTVAPPSPRTAVHGRATRYPMLDTRPAPEPKARAWTPPTKSPTAASIAAARPRYIALAQAPKPEGTGKGARNRQPRTVRLPPGQGHAPRRSRMGLPPRMVGRPTWNLG